MSVAGVVDGRRRALQDVGLVCDQNLLPGQKVDQFKFKWSFLKFNIKARKKKNFTFTVSSFGVLFLLANAALRQSDMRKKKKNPLCQEMLSHCSQYEHKKR